MKRYTIEEVNMILNMTSKGISPMDIAAKLGRDPTALNVKLHNMRRQLGQAGPSGPKSKLTPEQQLVELLDIPDVEFNRIKWTALGFTLGAVLVGVVMSWA
jgi:hypothetical protein